MNVYDSARMADVLAPLGYALTEMPDEADMIILNTCHIREKAVEKVYSELGRLRRLKARPRGEKSSPETLIAVAGCVAQAEGDEILRRAPYVDIVLGPQTYHRLPEMIARAGEGRRTGAAAGGRKNAPGLGVVETDFPSEPKFDFLPDVSAQGASAFLSIQEGCDKFCSFCVVPYTRGGEYSRPVDAVLDEARMLVAKGAREITLLGQNVNAYHGSGGGGKEWNLGTLIRALGEIENLERIRYTTSHPGDMADSLIRTHAEEPKLMPFVHLPVQTGSDRILKAMNRGYTAHGFRRLARRLRAARPDIALASDFIVGFPGETRADFEDTLALVRDIGFAQAYSFRFSARPGTPAANLPEQVDEVEAGERLAELQALLDEQQAAFNREAVGRIMPVLLDRRGRRRGQLAGRSPYMQAVHLDAAEVLLGELALVRIEAAHANSLSGRLVECEGDQRKRICA